MAEVVETQSNLAPIANLPPEILADIFVRCVPVTTRRLRTDASWLNITLVSKLWREVALACPDFWSTLVLTRPKWTPILLERSKMAALIIRADLGKTSPGSLQSVLLDNASRLGTLDIRSPSYYLDGLLYHLKDAGAAPRLQDVKIVSTFPEDFGDEGLWLPSDFFRRTEVVNSRKDGIGQGLRLHLESCVFPWNSAWYNHLTHLHLENITPNQRPTMETLLCILVGSPNLESFSLIHCSPTTLDGFLVELPHLSALTIKSAFSLTCMTLLGYLIIPSSTNIYASCDIDPADDGLDFQQMPTVVSPLWNVHPSTYDTVRIIHTNGLTYTLRDSARPWWSRKFRVRAEVWPHTILWAMASVAARLDFAHVTTLHLQGIVPRGEAVSMWCVLGRGLPSVRTLHLHQAFPSGWLEFMLTQAMYLIGLTYFRFDSYGLAFRDADGLPSHAWPGLRRLGLYGIDLGESAYLDDLLALRPSAADLLRALLWARREGGARICELEIEECENVFPQDLERFRLFADVVYDGKGETMVQKDAGHECPPTPMATIVERPVAAFRMSTSPTIVPQRRARESVEIIDVDSFEETSTRPSQRRRVEHDVIELLDSDEEPIGGAGAAGSSRAGVRVHRYMSPLPPVPSDPSIPPVPAVPQRYSGFTSLVPRPRAPRISPPPSSNLNAGEASSSSGHGVPAPILPISRSFLFESSPSPPLQPPGSFVPPRLEGDDLDLRPAPPARHNPPMGLGGALISSNNARVAAERLERQRRSERRAAGGRFAPLAAMNAGDGRNDTNTRRRQGMPQRSILSRLADLNPLRWGAAARHSDIDLLALRRDGDERTRGDAQLALDLYLADQEDALHARFAHPARGFARRELALMRGWVGGAGMVDEDYKKEWTHPGTADGGFVFDFAPSEIVPAVSGKGKGKEVVIDVDAEKEGVSTLLVCARCLDPLLVRSDGITDGGEDEARRRKVWGLRCGHLIDGKCFEELRKPVEDEPAPGEPSAPDEREPSPEPKGKGKGKGKAREVVDEEEEFDELFDENPLDNIRSRLRSRTSGPLPSTPGAFELAVPSPRRARRAPTKRKVKAKPKKRFVEARYEWNCPVAGCARVHISEKVDGAWVNAPEKGAIGVFV
ncbi:hypothetical protein B0H11DRAFT_2222637 [Mycena galericulata]|nr:hypothetical protein B0H11DRAFT_2222637 [Mycena galericulata]